MRPTTAVDFTKKKSNVTGNKVINNDDESSVILVLDDRDGNCEKFDVSWVAFLQECEILVKRGCSIEVKNIIPRGAGNQKSCLVKMLHIGS